MKKYLFLLIAILILASSCSSKKGSDTVTEIPVNSINSIAIMPVSHPHSLKDDVDSSMLNKGSAALTTLLTSYFKDQEEVRLINEDQFDSLGIDHNGSLISQSYAAGRQLNSDAVLLVTLNRYMERDGGDYSVNHPASVSFEYRLLHTESQSIICSGVYDETQEAFTDNILSFKNMFSRGFKWISTKQLAKEGLKNKLGECRYLPPTQK